MATNMFPRDRGRAPWGGATWGRYTRPSPSRPGLRSLVIQRSKEWERVKPHPSPLCAAYRRKTRFRTSCSGTDTELMRIPTELRCLLAPPHESVYYLTGYVGWCGGADIRLREDAEVRSFSKKVRKAPSYPPIDIQSRKWPISAVLWGARGDYFSTSRSGNHHMAAGGHQWTRVDQHAFV